MTEHGLAEVPNPSALFLAERRGNIAGSAVFAGLEGTRPVLMEVQALLSPNAGGSPRRSVIGWEAGRLAMLLAVLDSRAGLRLSAHDVYLNVAGGLRVGEPAADLAVVAALASAATETPTDAGSVYFGEVGLSGEIRQVAQAEARLKEAQKLGFAAAYLPRRVARGDRKLAAPAGLSIERDGACFGSHLGLHRGRNEPSAHVDRTPLDRIGPDHCSPASMRDPAGSGARSAPRHRHRICRSARRGSPPTAPPSAGRRSHPSPGDCSAPSRRRTGSPSRPLPARGG